MEKKFFAVVTLGGPIWGVGRNKDKAAAEAAEYIDGMTAEDIRRQAAEATPYADPGGLVILPCTKRLFRAVRDGGDGGAIPWTVTGRPPYCETIDLPDKDD